MKMQNKKQKGITLIALIITIVILLILATITVDVAIDGKLFDTAKDAVDKTNDRVAEEQGTIDELMNEWDKLQENTEDNPNTNTGGENNTTSGEENNNTGGGGEIIDNTPPIVTVTVGGRASNSITVNVIARDNETGMVSEPEYTYYIKEASAGTYEQKVTSKNSSYTYTGLTQGTTYDIKVEVNGDEEGNIGTGTTQGTTGTVTSALEEGAITFSNVIWSSGKARVTIHTNTNYDIEYQLNGISGSWTDIQNGGTISNLNHGTTIYARLTDGNNAGDYTSMDIQDKTDPTGTITINEITAESIKVTVNASDGESGLATSGTYAYYLNTESTARSTGTSNTYTYTNLIAKTQYTIKVVVKDKVGNEKEVTQTATTKKELAKPGVIVTETIEYEDTNGDIAVIPGGFTVSGAEGESTIEDGLVIYLIPDGTTIDWTNPTAVDTAQRTYDQFVWIPISHEQINNMYICQAKTGSNGNCNITVVNGVAKCTTHNSTQMAGRLYATGNGEKFEQGYTEVYTANSGLREPDSINSDNASNLTNLSSILGTTGYNTTANFKQSLQTEYNEIVKSVYENQGFYIGRYETSEMVNTNTNATVKIVAGTTEGIRNVNWYRMYAQQKKYAENKGLSSVKSTMIQGAAYDQVMKFVENGIRPNGGTYTIKTAGNASHLYLNQTGGRDETNYNDVVKNIYDLEGNVLVWTTEAEGGFTRISRGGSYNDRYSASNRYYIIEPEYGVDNIGSCIQLYIDV